MTEPTIHVPEGYRETHLRGLWALIGCQVRGGNGKYLVSDNIGGPGDYDEPTV
ncbi:hypothetical protein [Amycolatopsis sp. cg9]|uniref:hypothetical protein n=1 Tax=Amycolatopsis sp. cg9 TaxID=3238801 RepID=UPI00352449C4